MKIRYLSLLHEGKKYSSTIKDRKDCIRVLLEATRSLLYNNDVIEENECKYPYLKLSIEKQSRIYIYLSDSKYYSFSYNCQVEIDLGKKQVSSIYTKNGIACTIQLLSEALSILSEIKNCSLYDVYSSLDDEDILDEQAYRLLDFFWGCELGYVRYDYDKKNEKGLIHPLNHLDVNITEQAHYKLGITERISPETFEKIINENIDCYFLTKYENIKTRHFPKMNKKHNRRSKNNKHIKYKR